MTIRNCVPAVALAAATVLTVWTGGAGAAPSCQDVLRYLKADAKGRDGFVLRWDKPPVVTVALPHLPDQTPEDWTVAKADAEWAVWLINRHLPKNWQLRFDSRPALSGYGENEIRVVYLRKEGWAENIRDEALAKGFTRDTDGKLEFAVVLLDRTRLPEQHHRHYFLLHEMLHVLGRAHVDQEKFPETIMGPRAYKNDLKFLGALDKAALRAVYSPVIPVGTRGRDLRCDEQGRIRPRTKRRGRGRR